MFHTFTDSEFDPSAVKTPSWVTVLNTTYDASTRVRTQTFDTDLDRNPNVTEATTYDAAGRRIKLKSSFDFHGDGTFNRVSDFTFNEAGTRIKAEVSVDANNDGLFDSRGIRTYHADGSLKYSETQWLVSPLGWLAAVDSNGDGTDDRTVRYIHDEHNRVLSENWVNIPGTPTTTPSRLIRYTYDDDDRVLTETWDNGINGTIDRRINNTYHADGSLKYSETQSLVDGLPRTATVDSNGDGTDDRTVDYTYDQHNRLLSERWVNIPGARTYTASRLIRYTYDDDNRLLTETWDNHINNTIDRRITNTYDDHGGRVKTVDHSGNRFQQRTDTFTYDANNNLLTETWDFGWTDGIDFSSVRTYGAHNNVLTEALDYDADGTNDVTNIYTYDADGTKIRKAGLYDDGDNGTIDRVWYRSYGAEVDTIEPTAQNAQALAGVQKIFLSEGASRLIISDSVLSVLAGGDDSHRVRIDGDGDDSVVLGQGIRDSGQDVEINGEQYDLYTGT
ncbi:RHS repeat protein, partial [Ruegeria atlantica]|uniref:RHS repeat protein n=1 Tax=Ruegeria atlantica TaxID=81569 RepID=UPI00147C0FD5